MVVYVRGNPELPGSGFFPPALNAYSIHKYLLSMVETVQMAFLALILSVIISFPLLFCIPNTLEIILPGKEPQSEGPAQGPIRSDPVYRQSVPFD